MQSQTSAHPTQHILFQAIGFLCLGLFSMAGLAANNPYDMPIGVTEISQEIFRLHRSMFYCCVAIGAGVFIAMFYSIFKHRKSVGHKAAQFHESTVVEIIWTVIPFIILILMAIPATRVLMDLSDTSESELTIKITASQWKWHYEYLEYEGDNSLNLGFFSNLSTPRDQYETPISATGLFPSGLAALTTDQPPASNPEKNPFYLLEVDNPMVIPTGQKVRFLLTSDDVIHSWWMPDFGIKKDTIPGFINESWTLVPEGKEGTYRGKCTELCGKDHGFMPVVVEAKSQSEFKQWLADSQAAQAKAEAEAASGANEILTMAQSMELGEPAYIKHCAACHQANGAGLPPTFPALAGADIAINPDRIGEHINIVRNGKGAMPAFKDVLTPKEFATIITYERNAEGWGNDTGDIIQPKDTTYDHE